MTEMKRENAEMKRKIAALDLELKEDNAVIRCGCSDNPHKHKH